MRWCRGRIATATLSYGRRSAFCVPRSALFRGTRRRGGGLVIAKKEILSWRSSEARLRWPRALGGSSAEAVLHVDDGVEEGLAVADGGRPGAGEGHADRIGDVAGRRLHDENAIGQPDGFR